MRFWCSLTFFVCLRVFVCLPVASSFIVLCFFFLSPSYVIYYCMFIYCIVVLVNKLYISLCLILCLLCIV